MGSWFVAVDAVALDHSRACRLRSFLSSCCKGCTCSRDKRRSMGFVWISGGCLGVCCFLLSACLISVVGKIRNPTSQGHILRCDGFELGKNSFPFLQCCLYHFDIPNTIRIFLHDHDQQWTTTHSIHEPSQSVSTMVFACRKITMALSGSQLMDRPSHNRMGTTK